MVAEARNWVREGCNTTGTGPLALIGAISGSATFAQAFGASPVEIYYCVEDKTTQYREAGIGTFNGVDQITRDTPREIFANGSYGRGTPNPINLEGDSEVFCSMTSGAFNDLLQKTDAAGTYVPLTATDNSVTGTTSLTMVSDLIEAKAIDGGAYADVSNDASVVTVASLNIVPRPWRYTNVNHTLTLADANGMIVASKLQGAVEPVVIYIPTNASVPFKVGDEVSIISYLWGEVTVQPVSGVTLATRSGAATPAQLVNNTQATLSYVNDDYWILSGLLEDA